MISSRNSDVSYNSALAIDLRLSIKHVTRREIFSRAATSVGVVHFV